MKVENVNQDSMKRFARDGKTLLYVSLIPYKNNTCIKVYDEDGNPLGDIPQKDILSYINKSNEVLFIKELIDDNTGLPVYTLGTIEE